MFRLFVKEEVAVITVNGRERTLREIMMGTHAPIVNPIVSRLVEVTDSILKAMIM
jgi:hypothetical protein